jgi:2,4-dienoyl-CoA reductase-like NADH-dependent reductase (Old Yellow Enzyme family)
MLYEHGAGLIHVVAGQTVPDAHPSYGRGYLTTLSDIIRNEARVPTMVGGYLRTADEANTILAAGRADLCIMQPELPDRRTDLLARVREAEAPLERTAGADAEQDHATSRALQERTPQGADDGL